MAIVYDKGTTEFTNWLVTEDCFDPSNLGKCESIMSLGNGYLGLRSATEEAYLGEVRNLFVAGTFNRFDENEVTELPNAADITEIEIMIDGERFSLENGTIIKYVRNLNLKTGEITREIIWKHNEKQFLMLFRRFVSQKNLHLIANRIEITPLSAGASIELISGINGQVTNSGAQHFSEGEKRIFDRQFMQFIQTTTETKIDFVQNAVHRYEVDGEQISLDEVMILDRRKVLLKGNISIKKESTFIFEKLSNVYTSRDLEYDTESYDLEIMRKDALNNLKDEFAKGYEALLRESIEKLNDYYRSCAVEIYSEDAFDQLAIRFSAYHLKVMTPSHDNRMGIAAKGLSGEGYKGHSFWDTEIFILPYFTYTFPQIARSLLEYRYNTIDGARKKARDNGYKGAMYPWESAFTGEEVTPVWGGVDIVTGKATKIWSGFIEQHITCDISYAVWQYYKVTNDLNFMQKFGYEMLLDTAIFWASRLEWDDEKEHYAITNVIGPDEYKEHVNNNAFTNHMAYWNIQIAIEYYHYLKQNDIKSFNKLNAILNLEENILVWKDVVHKIYVPQPNEEGIIPQDDTYLTLKEIDLTKYKNQKHVGSLFRDYNLEQVNKMQVSKQADVMALLYLLENKYSYDIKQKNWDYYESRTLHDSSLSLSLHCALASDMNDSKLAYDLFQKASRIDLGTNMKSSDHGIHTASIGGIWQSVICGFGGVRMIGGDLRINPKLPSEWTTLSYNINWKGNHLKVNISKNSFIIENMGSKSVSFLSFDQQYLVEANDKVEVII